MLSLCANNSKGQTIKCQYTYTTVDHKARDLESKAQATPKNSIRHDRNHTNIIPPLPLSDDH